VEIPQAKEEDVGLFEVLCAFPFNVLDHLRNNLALHILSQMDFLNGASNGLNMGKLVG
jgi:hypothetical protein